MLNSQTHKFNGDADFFTHSNDPKSRHKALILEAVLAKIFASITSIKAAYAELQMAQHPYNSKAIQVADQAVVDELKALSDLKRSFLKKQVDLSPQVTFMLAEIQEQQSLMKTYEITIKKLQTEIETKRSDVVSLKKKLDDSLAFNKSMEKKLNASGSLANMFDYIQFSTVNSSHFVQVLHYTLRSLRSFVKSMAREMESARWDLDAAAKSIEPDAVFARPSHRCFAFESFVCKTMFENFDSPNFSLCTTGDSLVQRRSPEQYFNRLKKLKSMNAIQFLSQNPTSSFAKFIRVKYLNLVHAKMECSLFGNLNQRKLVTAGGLPDSAFFCSFAEMTKRVWLLHCLAFSLGKEISIFQVKKNSRFSEVYMENITDESIFSGENSDDIRVGFTVVPGFKIGGTLIQSQVYLPPVVTAPAG